MMAVRQRQWRSSLLFVCFLTFCLFSAVFLADELSIAVTSGMQLAIGTIIPSLFPFMILADLAVCSMPSESGVIGKQFQKLLNLDSSTLSTFVIGNLSGAPVGAGMISSLRINGKISREEAERAFAISSGPSLAFTVSGVGAAMWGKAYIGVILYLSVILSSVAYAIFTRGKHLARSSTPSSRK